MAAPARAAGNEARSRPCPTLPPAADPGLDGFRSSLAGADTDDVLHRGDEDLSVPDPSGASALDDGLDGFRDPLVRDQHGDLHLGEEVDDVLRPAVELRVALLAAEALHLAHRQALHPHVGQPLLHLVELVGLDDRVDPFHGLSALSKTPTTTALQRRGGPARAAGRLMRDR